MQTRTRTVMTPAKNGGTCNDLLQQSQPCAPPCVSCVMSEWSAGMCLADCGTGTKAQSRSATRAATCASCAQCPTDVSRQVPCDSNKPCDNPERCQYVYSAWSVCECILVDSDGSGTQRRERTSTVPLCMNFTESSTCPCPVDCQFSPFTDFSACNPACGEGLLLFILKFTA